MTAQRLPLLVYGIAVAQLVSWATLYYAFAVLVVPMESELGWPRTTLTAGATLGLLTAGLLAPLVGRVLDRQGGFWPMTVGSALGALALLIWSTAETVAVFWLAWVLVGIAMACTFYEAGFAVVTAASGNQYRRAITTVTLIAGFAGTVALPLTQALVTDLGWRHALMVLAVVTLVVPGGLHAALLRNASAPLRQSPPDTARLAVRRARRSPAYWGLLIGVVANAVSLSGVMFHVIAMLGERGFTASEVVAAWALVGPAQVAARGASMAFGTRLGTLAAGVVGFGLTSCSLVLLLATSPGIVPLVLAPLTFGAGNGLLTIVRAATVPDLLGREGYASIAGTIALPSMVAIALGPTIVSLIWASSGYGLALGLLLALELAGAAAFVTGVVWHRRRTARLSAASLPPPDA